MCENLLDYLKTHLVHQNAADIFWVYLFILSSRPFFTRFGLNMID